MNGISFSDRMVVPSAHMPILHNNMSKRMRICPTSFRVPTLCSTMSTKQPQM